MNLRPLIIMLLALPIINACSNKKEEFDERLVGVQFVEIPFTEMSKGETMSIKVVMGASNECGDFNRFEENWLDDNTLELKAYLRYPKEGVCAQVVKTVEKTYEFTPKEVGENVLKFYAGGPFLSKRIFVR